MNMLYVEYVHNLMKMVMNMDLSKLALIQQNTSSRLTLPFDHVGQIPLTSDSHTAQVAIVNMEQQLTVSQNNWLQQIGKKMPVVLLYDDISTIPNQLPKHFLAAPIKEISQLQSVLFEAYMIVVRTYFQSRVTLTIQSKLEPYTWKLSKTWRTTKADELRATYKEQFLRQELPTIFQKVAHKLLLPLSPRIAFYEIEQQISQSTEDRALQKKLQKVSIPNKLQKKIHKSTIQIAEAFEEDVLMTFRQNQEIQQLVDAYMAPVKIALQPPNKTHYLNVALIGQTGVGKSSLINYLFDSPKRATGAGKPVTEQGFFKENLLLNNVPVSLIDSWGIEQGKAEIWQQQFEQFLKRHNYEADVADWVHIAVYCISAATSRIQDFDLSIIKMLQRQKINVLVALTKTSLVQDDTIQALQQTLQLEFGKKVPIIPVNSVAQTLLSGEKIEQHGKDALIHEMQLNYLTMLENRLPERIQFVLQQHIQTFDRRAISECSSANAATKLSKQKGKLFFEEVIPYTIEREVALAMNAYDQAMQLSNKRRSKQTIQPIKLSMFEEWLSTVEQFIKTTFFKQTAVDIGAAYDKKMSHQLKQLEPTIQEATIQRIQQLSKETNYE